MAAARADDGWPAAREGARAREGCVAPGECDPSQGIGALRPAGASPAAGTEGGVHRRARRRVRSWPICAQLPIAPSTYYEQKARAADPTRVPRRTERHRQLRPEVERLWRAARCAYRAKKVWNQLNREAMPPARWNDRAADLSADLR